MEICYILMVLLAFYLYKLNSMKILTSGDRNYIPGIATMLKSLDLNLKKEENEQVEITIVSMGINYQEKQKLEACCRFKIDWQDFIVVDGDILSMFGSKLSYVKMMPDKYVNAEERLLWIDADTIVLGDLEPLWTMDLEGMVIAATANPWGNPNNYQDQNLYLNTGVLVYDMKIWRGEKLSEKITENVINNIWSDHEQGAFNSVLMGRWKQLERIWNNENTDRNTSTRIMHFIYKPKPWENPHRNQQWVEIFSQTPFQDELKEMENRYQSWFYQLKIKYGRWYGWVMEPIVKFKSFYKKKLKH
jgi:lipopolysaccharide biosynthesis glycosyltransferase